MNYCKFLLNIKVLMVLHYRPNTDQVQLANHVRAVDARQTDQQDNKDQFA